MFDRVIVRDNLPPAIPNMPLSKLTPNSSRFVTLMALVAFAVLFLFHIYPIGLSDALWHLNTGRWIWGHGALPTSDPFTYSSMGNLDANRQSYWQHLVLQGYWLAQLFFYAVHAALGMWGLVLLKAMLFVTLYWLVWRALLQARVNPLVGLLAVLALPWLLYRYDELRPQIFSFIGVVLVFMILTQALVKLRNGIEHPLDLMVLPFVMLLWANLHPGFMLGWVVIIVTLAGVAFDQWRGINKLSRGGMRTLFLWCGIALCASIANPLTYSFITNIIVMREQYALGVDEFLPLYQYARMYQRPSLFYGVLMLALGVSGFLLRCWRRVSPAHVFLFLGFAAAGFSAFRYMIFFVLMALMIGLPHISAWLEPYLLRAQALLVVLVFAAVSGVAYLAFQHGAWKQGAVETAYVPAHAADFILAQHPPAPLFNAYEYGGYLGWKLAPEYQVFIDPRCLDFEVFDDYQTARGGHYQKVFEKYGVNSVAFYIFTPVINSIPEITLYLLMDAQWDLVYADKISVVMVRRSQNTLSAIDKAPLLGYLQDVLMQTLKAAPDKTQALVQYGRVLHFRGDVAGAKQRFRQALKINPQLRAPRFYLAEIARQERGGNGVEQ